MDADDQNVARHERQLGNLALEDRLSADDERALVPAAEPGRTAAGEYRGTLHPFTDRNGFNNCNNFIEV
jgi:hypothetical protein